MPQAKPPILLIVGGRHRGKTLRECQEQNVKNMATARKRERGEDNLVRITYGCEGPACQKKRKTASELAQWGQSSLVAS